MSQSLESIVGETLKREFSSDPKIAIRGAIERVFFLDGEIRRTMNRIESRAKRADMIGAVDPDDVKEGLDNLASALNYINAAFDSFESAADVWGVTPEEIAEIVNAGGGRITEPLPQPGTFLQGDGELEVEIRQLATDKYLIIAPDVRTEYIGSIDTAMSIYDVARQRVRNAAPDLNDGYTVHPEDVDPDWSDPAVQERWNDFVGRPEDVPGYPFK